MKAKLVREWIRPSVKVWLYDDGPDGIYVLGGDGSMNHHPRQAELPEPTFTLPEQALAALVAEASQILPASDATSAHLADTIAVRDRLLTLVEKRR